MKKVFIAAAIILGGLSTFAKSAVALNQPTEVVIGLPSKFKQIKTSELPKAVLEALASDYNTATIDKAYVNSNQEYKLHISVQEVTSAVHTERVYADKDGNWIPKGKISIPATSTNQEITQHNR